MHATTPPRQEIINATDECVMCGLCLPHCPTYMVSKNEAESPRGRIALIRALHENKLPLSATLVKHLDNCLTCMACENVCPAKVDYEKILDAGREITHDHHSYINRFQRSLFLSILARPQARQVTRFFINVYHGLRVHKLLAKVSTNTSSALRLFKLIPPPPKTATLFSTNGKTGAECCVILINNCASDLFTDSTKASAMHILNAINCEVAEMTPTYCCGALHQHSGNIKKAKNLLQNLSTSIADEDYEALISIATGCGAHLNHHPELFSKHVDINTFVLQRLNEYKLNFKLFPKTVFIHQPCSQKFVSDDVYIVEKLLKKIPRIRIKYFQDELICCGAGGLNSITQAKLANEIISKKIDEISASDASYLVTSNIGCALHFQSNLLATQT